MSIFLSVLAVIGKILLILLLVVLVLILYLLFTPFMYRADGAFGDDNVFVAKLHDFSHFFGITTAYSGGMAIEITLLWGLVKIPLGGKKKHENNVKQENGTEPSSADKSGRQAKKASRKTSEAEETEAEAEKNVQEAVKNAEGTAGKAQKAGNKKEKSSSGKKKSLPSAILGNLDGLNYIIKQVFSLLGKMKPTVLTADLDYSTGEPDTTGYVTGVLALFPFVYGKKKCFRPDFQADEPYISGTIGLKGNIFLFQAVYIIIRIIANKDSRAFIGDVLGAVKQQKKDKAAKEPKAA